MHRKARARERWSMLLVLASTMTACRPPQPAAVSPPQPAAAPVLEVVNHSLFEVNVFAVPSVGPTRVPLGTVAAFLRTPLTIPPDA